MKIGEILQELVWWLCPSALAGSYPLLLGLRHPGDRQDTFSIKYMTTANWTFARHQPMRSLLMTTCTLGLCSLLLLLSLASSPTTRSQSPHSALIFLFAGVKVEQDHGKLCQYGAPVRPLHQGRGEAEHQGGGVDRRRRHRRQVWGPGARGHPSGGGERFQG